MQGSWLLPQHRRECSVELRCLASKHLGRIVWSSRRTAYHSCHAISHHPKKCQDLHLRNATFSQGLPSRLFQTGPGSHHSPDLSLRLRTIHRRGSGSRPSLSRIICLGTRFRRQASSHVPACKRSLFVFH